MIELAGLSARRCISILTQEFDRAGIADSKSDARLLIFHVLQTNLTELWTRDLQVTPQQAKTLSLLAARRMQGEPIAYITGEAWFMGLSIHVTPDCLIPRFDTEIVAQTAMQLAPREGRIADLCTGSGCIALAIKRRRPDLDVWAYDVSAQACAVAQHNANRLNLKINVRRGDLFTPFEGVFDEIVSNPPYIPRADMETLMQEVKREPSLALLGGEDGLDFYRRIVPGARNYLKPEGSLVLEVGDGQAKAVCALLADAGYQDISVKDDIAGLPRMVAGKWRKWNA